MVINLNNSIYIQWQGDIIKTEDMQIIPTENMSDC